MIVTLTMMMSSCSASIGSLDEANGNAIAGWCTTPGVDQSSAVHVYNGAILAGFTNFVVQVPAGVARPDVYNAYGGDFATCGCTSAAGCLRGFNSLWVNLFSIAQRQQYAGQTITPYVYCLDVGGGSNNLIGTAAPFTFPASLCNVDCVLSAFSAWSTCSAPCGTGSQSASCSVVQPTVCGGAQCGPLTMTQACNTQCCPVACVVGQWGAFGACSLPCGGGVYSRSRSVAQPAVCGGAACDTLGDTEACNTQCCPVDCVLSSWINGPCSVTCGVGTYTRTRTVRFASYARLFDVVVGCNGCRVRRVVWCVDGHTTVLAAVLCRRLRRVRLE
jgi:hypothetical protein